MTSSGGERGGRIVVRQLEGMPRRKPGRSRGRRALASRGSLKCGNPANRRVIESTGVCSATEDVRFNYQLTFLPSLTAERRAVPIRKSAARKLDDARSTVLRPVSADPPPPPPPSSALEFLETRRRGRRSFARHLLDFCRIFDS